MRMNDASDSVLIQATLAGDESAFAELIARYQRAVWGTVRRVLNDPAEAEDAVQEIFLRALVSLGRFDARYPFGPWILRIAANHCIDQLRRRKTRRHRLWSDLSESEQARVVTRTAVRPNPEQVSDEERATYLQLAQSLLDRLKPKQRVAFVLREIEGRSYQAVAEVMGISEPTARVLVHRARAALHSAFRRHQAGVNRGRQNEEALRLV
jgi:RNA polymerase sigma-70 factor (ECF subfamily)